MTESYSRRKNFLHCARAIHWAKKPLQQPVANAGEPARWGCRWHGTVVCGGGELRAGRAGRHGADHGVCRLSGGFRTEFSSRATRTGRAAWWRSSSGTVRPLRIRLNTANSQKQPGETIFDHCERGALIHPAWFKKESKRGSSAESGGSQRPISSRFHQAPAELPGGTNSYR